MWCPIGLVRVWLACWLRIPFEHWPTLRCEFPRLCGWWRAVPGLGAANARRIEEFFASHPSLTEGARALVRFEQDDLIPWERLRLPNQVNGSRGTFRAPRRSCVLSASNDYEAV